MPLDGWEETRFGEYTAMTTSFPEILEKTSIGGYHDDVLDSELILTAKPDVLLINRSQYSENETSIPVFEKAGIKVVVLDYHKMKLENHIKSTEILGVLLGREDGDQLRGKKVLIVDDVISTGESLAAVVALADKFEANIVAKAAVLAEGDAAERDDIVFLEKLPLFFK